MSLLTGLVSYWKLDGNSNDSHGINNGVDTSVSYIAGKINQAANYVLSNSKITIPSSTSLNSPTTALTFSLWVNITTYENNRFIAIKTFGGGSGDYYFGTSSIKFYARSSAGTGVVNSLENITTGTWNHLSMVYVSGVSLEFFVNGISQGVDLSPGTIQSANESLTIGGYAFADISIKGTVDEVGLWSRALTTDEITELYNSGAGLTYPFLSGSKSNFFQYLI